MSRQEENLFNLDDMRCHVLEFFGPDQRFPGCAPHVFHVRHGAASLVQATDAFAFA